MPMGFFYGQIVRIRVARHDQEKLRPVVAPPSQGHCRQRVLPIRLGRPRTAIWFERSPRFLGRADRSPQVRFDSGLFVIPYARETTQCQGCLTVYWSSWREHPSQR
jgi:hypothetical protein